MVSKNPPVLFKVYLLWQIRTGDGLFILSSKSKVKTLHDSSYLEFTGGHWFFLRRTKWYFTTKRLSSQTQNPSVHDI